MTETPPAHEGRSRHWLVDAAIGASLALGLITAAKASLPHVARIAPLAPAPVRFVSRPAQRTPAPEPVLDKLDEEIGELKEAIAAPTPDQAHIEEELGDMLFVVANLCRKLSVDPEVALRGANAKFIRRFHGMEALARSRGVDFASLSLDQQEALWVEVKKIERA